MAFPKRLDTAVAAEEVMDSVATELVVRQSVLTLQQPERVGFNNGLPEPRLGTDRAIALARTLGQVDFTFEADTPAMTASSIWLLHWHTLVRIIRGMATIRAMPSYKGATIE